MDTFFPAYLLYILFEFRQCFSKPNFVYFKAYVWSMMINAASKCMTNTAQTCFFLGKHVSTFERFLSENKWDIYAVRKKLVELILEQYYPCLMVHGALLAVYDTTIVEKTSEKMLGVQRWHNSTGTADKRTSVFGHHWGLVGLVFSHTIRYICFPILARLIPGNLNQQQWVSGIRGTKAMDFWDASLAAIYELRSYIPAFIKLRIVADAYFSKLPFLEGLRSQCIHLISRLRRDAKGWDSYQPSSTPKRKRGRPRKKGKEWKLADLIKPFPLEPVSVLLYGETQLLNVIVRDVFLRDFKELVRVVVIQTAASPFLLVSTDLSLSAQQIIEIYGSRFSIELSIRDLKQHFGFGDYQCYSTLAFIRFVSLSCVSFGLWMFTLLHNQDSFLTDSSPASFHSESPLSFLRLKRAFRRFVCKQIIFQKFSNHAEFEKINSEFESLLRIAS